MIGTVLRADVCQRVLVVDDDTANRVALVDLLGDEGFGADGVEDGRQALSWVRRHDSQTGLVLLDLMMPVMDGDAFLCAKECDPAIAQLPVVLMTASGATACEWIARTHHLHSFIHKPVAIAVLLGLLTGLFAKSRETV